MSCKAGIDKVAMIGAVGAIARGAGSMALKAGGSLVKNPMGTLNHGMNALNVVQNTANNSQRLNQARAGMWRPGGIK